MFSLDDLPSLLSRVPEDALGICARLRERGRRAWIVGGCVRDLIRGIQVHDWDIATDARPEEVVRHFKHVIPTGIEHGTVTVVVRKVPYEVTTLRGETTYSDGRRPDSVHFVDDITADLARRDFTINAIAIDPITGSLIDPFDGLADLEAGIIRAVGDPLQRFSEDGLRPLRAARFVASLEFEIEQATLAAMGDTLDTYRKVSPERIREEWIKAMRAPRPSRAFEIMRHTKMLDVTVPEMVESIGCEQNRFHAYDVWGHAMACLDACEGDPALRISALFHDIGKPRTRAFSDKTQDYTFYDHERVGAEMVYPILTRLRFSNEERERITHLVRHHLVCYSDEWSDAAVRRWMRRIGHDRIEDLYALNRADILGKGKEPEADLEALEKLKGRVAKVLSAGDALTVKALKVNGRDLMTELGMKPGRDLGTLLEYLLEQVIDEPSQNERETLLALGREWLLAKGSP